MFQVWCRVVGVAVCVGKLRGCRGDIMVCVSWLVTLYTYYILVQ